MAKCLFTGYGVEYQDKAKRRVLLTGHWSKAPRVFERWGDANQWAHDNAEATRLKRRRFRVVKLIVEVTSFATAAPSLAQVRAAGKRP
jgi:hypothetical protein